MSLGNAHIKGALGHLLHHDIHRTASRHGWSNAYNLRILTGQFQQCLTKDILKARRRVLIFIYQSLARFEIELSRCVPYGDILLGRGVAVTFLGVQMEQLGTFHPLQLSEDAHQFLDVVPVERPEVADVHAFEHVLLVGDGRLHRIGEADESAAAVVLHQSYLVEPA